VQATKFAMQGLTKCKSAQAVVHSQYSEYVGQFAEQFTAGAATRASCMQDTILEEMCMTQLQ